jgi:hypothetical protein
MEQKKPLPVADHDGKEAQYAVPLFCFSQMYPLTGVRRISLQNETPMAEAISSGCTAGGISALLSPYEVLSAGNPCPDSFRSSSKYIIHHKAGFVNYLQTKRKTKNPARISTNPCKTCGIYGII